MYEINMSSKTALFFDRLYEADRASSSRANNTALLPPEANAGYDNSMTRANHSASAFSAASVGSHGRSYSHADLTSRLLESSGTSSYPAVLAPNSHHNLDHTNGHRESGKLNTSAHSAQPATSAFLESSSSAWARHSETRPEFESRSTFQSPEFLAKSGTNFNTSIVSSRTEFIAIDHPVRSTLAQGSESGSIVTPRSYYVRSDSARSRSPPVSSYPHSQSHDAPLPPTRPSHHSYLPPSSRSAVAPEPNGHLPTYHPPVSSDNPPVALTGQGWVDRSVPPSSKSSYHLDSATHHSHFVGPSREPFTGRGPLYPPSSSAAPMRISSIASHDSTTPPLHPSMAIKDRAEGWERLPPTWDSSHVSRPPIPSYSTNHTHAVSGDDPRMDASGDRASSVLATDHSVERNDHPDLHGVASPLSIKSNGSAHDSHADEHQSSHAAAASFEEEQKRKSRDASARYRKRKNQEFEDQKKTISKLKAMVQSLETENTVLKRHIKALMSNKDQSKAPAEPTGSKDSARPPSDPA
ncbi:uncharacterized protein BJ171DRAFT_277900 [Polychytrium aggregatum]|uniref:uncharacterized protein n=1 Tax=Polychytrium aggregatum TaxID=110093 RepID=UPI0022FF0A93|nr:uncharacterized protein BJ171DRAFT_277900 [Polychytrium aggregatum]KAI9207581.1 hypothetical protein BJ171DRAFT_277900 [Polychytrium aggregatum]